MKRIVKLIMIMLCVALIGCTAVAFTGCNNEGNGSVINKAVGREADSGTRSAFEENVKSADGVLIQDALKEKQYASCVSESSETAAVITQVAQRYDTIGYISLGSLAPNSDRIQAVKLNGVEATAENVVNKTYPISKPFHLLFKQKTYDGNDLVRNFISYIESSAGQKIIEDEGCVLVAGLQLNEYKPYEGDKTEIKIDGSTSMYSVMTKLAEAFEKLNSSVTVSVEKGGSGVGIADAQSGKVDIGLSSRDLKASETGIVAHKIADDGIAIIVKKGSALKEVTFAQLFDLYINGTPIEIPQE